MAGEPKNLTIRILQEMRDELRARFEGIDRKRQVIDQRCDDMTQRFDGNTLTFDLVAGVTYDLEQRIDMLEERRLPRR